MHPPPPIMQLRSFLHPLVRQPLGRDRSWLQTMTAMRSGYSTRELAKYLKIQYSVCPFGTYSGGKIPVWGKFLIPIKSCSSKNVRQRVSIRLCTMYSCTMSYNVLYMYSIRWAGKENKRDTQDRSC